ncbi:MAG: hypothetical protein OXQ32_09455 [bacterium]|nr:hypothetical protein [bacterium]
MSWRRLWARRVLTLVTIGWVFWMAWLIFRDDQPFTLYALDGNGQPMGDVTVIQGGQVVGITDLDGGVELEWVSDGRRYVLVSPGHLQKTVTVAGPAQESMTVHLKPRTLRGRVTDLGQIPVEGALVSSGPVSTVTDPDGRFLLEGVEQGEVLVTRPAWVGAQYEWDGGPGDADVIINPLVVKAVHVSGTAAGDRQQWDAMVRLVDETELNGVMLDLKDETGLIFYNSQVEAAREVGAVYPEYDLAGIAESLEKRDIYLIGRIVAFQDPTASVKRPTMAVWDAYNDRPYQQGNQFFLDPTDPDARAYALELAVEACELGVDEIQFDYIRFPDSRRPSATFDGPIDPDSRVAAITSFLEEARALLWPMGCAVAADIFGFLTTVPDDGGIGQQWEKITETLDVVSPMLYPSHYDSGWFGFEQPNDHPGEVVNQALADAVARVHTGVVIRPWLQDFGYRDSQVRSSIDAAEGFDLGWMLWNPVSDVSVGALRTDDAAGG